MYYILPITEDFRQVFTLDMAIDGVSFHARVVKKGTVLFDTFSQ